DPRIAPILPALDRQDIDLQDVAGLCPLDLDRPGEDVGSEPRGHRPVDRAMVGEDLEIGIGGQYVAAARYAVDGHRVARFDGHDRLQRRVEKTPMTVRGPALDGVML